MIKEGWNNSEQVLKEIKAKEIENIKATIALESQKKIKELETTHQQEQLHYKKEMKKALEKTLAGLKMSYEDEIRLLKKNVKDQDKKITLLKKMCVRKDTQIQMLEEKAQSNEKQDKLQKEHRDILFELARAFKEGTTPGKDSTTNESGTPY
eukprot:CAMPEP_0197001850 /NCGR_PEP_ID=MMETSP1380-20130617/6458_1 /TAXON_ID=5936 /ORGANISM="Euplotes crassus, Strain CT5" /LENGTH=151 /DNA_ID=CAMNT_0042419693 /DNA_START=363 /DNA_END=818 /DNA_ORIENTATION=+